MEVLCLARVGRKEEKQPARRESSQCVVCHECKCTCACFVPGLYSKCTYVYALCYVYLCVCTVYCYCMPGCACVCRRARLGWGLFEDTVPHGIKARSLSPRTEGPLRARGWPTVGSSYLQQKNKELSSPIFAFQGFSYQRLTMA